MVSRKKRAEKKSLKEAGSEDKLAHTILRTTIKSVPFRGPVSDKKGNHAQDYFHSSVELEKCVTVTHLPEEQTGHAKPTAHDLSSAL